MTVLQKSFKSTTGGDIQGLRQVISQSKYPTVTSGIFEINTKNILRKTSISP